MNNQPYDSVLNRSLKFNLLVITLLMISIIVFSYMTINTISKKTSEVIYANSLRSQFDTLEISHLSLTSKIEEKIKNNLEFDIHRGTDGKDCQLCRWLSGDGRNRAETIIPQLKPIILELEKTHKNLFEPSTLPMFLKAPNLLPDNISETETDIREVFNKSTAKINKILQMMKTITNNSLITDEELDKITKKNERGCIIFSILAFLLSIPFSINVFKLIKKNKQNLVRMDQELSELNTEKNEVENNLNALLNEKQLLEKEKGNFLCEVSTLNETIATSTKLLELYNLFSENHHHIELYKKLLNFLCNHINSHLGALYVADYGEKMLKFAVSFPKDKSGKMPPQIPFGEGLAGEAVLNKTPGVFCGPPSGYKKTTSVLGFAESENILVYPLVYDDKTICVIEMATNEKLPDKVLNFFNQANERIASEINRSHSRDRIKEKLTNALERNKELEYHLESLKKAKKAAELSKSEAMAISGSKGAYISNLSKKIRTPMNGIFSMIDMLRDTPLDEEQQDFTEYLKTSADSLLVNINDMLDFSRIEAGQLEIQTIEFNLQITIENMSDIMAMKAEEKGLEFILFINDNVPSRLKGDPGRLRQILMNLTSNAIKFCDQGEVIISVFLKNITEENVRLFFEVTDTGQGIPSYRRNNIFKTLIEEDETESKKYGFAGPGLTISKHLVDLMGGKIGVESVEGKGTTFWFTADFKIQPERKEIPLAIPEEIRGTNVLILNDNQRSRMVLKDYLSSWQCNYEEAINTKQAIQKLQDSYINNKKIKVIIVDIQMQGINEENLGKKIKSIPEAKEASLILTASAWHRGDARKMKDAGFSAFLTKPLKKRYLFDCIRTVIGFSTSDGKTELITRYTLEENKVPKTITTGTPYKILVAEDNRMNQKVVENMLKKMGHDTTIVNNGLEAVEAFEGKSFDFVLLDTQMPGMNGVETAIRMREIEKSGMHIPIIALSASAKEEDKKRYISAGMNDLIFKPVKKNSLAEILDKHTSNKTS